MLLMKRPSSLRRKVLLFLAPLILGAAVAEESGKYVLLPEPSFMWHKHGQKIPGSRRTVLIPALTTSAGLRELSPEAFAELGVSWAAFSKTAGTTADAHLKTLKPVVTKDSEGHAAVAVVKSKSAITASVVFAPGFVAKFEPIFGDRLLVAIPDRFTIYVFPRALSTHKEYGKRLAALYEDAVYPASLELFEADPQGVRVVGSFSGGGRNGEK